jgi:cytochrome c peroxidase
LDGMSDFGRERVTGDPNDRYKFRTPPLRNVAATSPWMHDGAFTNLEDIVRRHNDLVGSAMNYDVAQLEPLLQDTVRTDETPTILATLDPDLSDLTLSDDETDDLVAFLHALTDPAIFDLPATDIPDSVPSGLPLDSK